jgi:hypothetical protein
MARTFRIQSMVAPLFLQRLNQQPMQIDLYGDETWDRSGRRMTTKTNGNPITGGSILTDDDLSWITNTTVDGAINLSISRIRLVCVQDGSIMTNMPPTKIRPGVHSTTGSGG